MASKIDKDSDTELEGTNAGLRRALQQCNEQLKQLKKALARSQQDNRPTSSGRPPPRN